MEAKKQSAIGIAIILGFCTLVGIVCGVGGAAAVILFR
jgi:hypothetical protein